jgi:dTDP-4-dehydrorhamnose 3,5-epimerase
MFSNLKTDLSGLILIAHSRYGDHRGFFAETYNQRDYTKLGVNVGFVQDNHSLSASLGTVRGLHFQAPPQAQAKLVRRDF